MVKTGAATAATSELPRTRGACQRACDAGPINRNFGVLTLSRCEQPQGEARYGENQLPKQFSGHQYADVFTGVFIVRPS